MQKSVQLRLQRRMQAQLDAADGVGDDQFGRVQKQALEPPAAKRLIGFLLAVAFVADDGMARWAACTRIWWVRPVTGLASTKVASANSSWRWK